MTSIMNVSFDSDNEAIIFTISLQEWSTKQMIIHLNFTDPLAVSSGEHLDKMLVEILLAQLFVSSKSLEAIADKDRNIAHLFPKQLPSGVSEVTL